MTNAAPIDLLTAWVVRSVPGDAAIWFEERIARLRSGAPDKDLYLALGYAIRRLGKSDLRLSSGDLAMATAAQVGWDPGDWSVDQAARLAFILATDDGDAAKFKARLEQLFRTADIGELIAFYRGLPLYPYAELHVARAREGARSAMQPIFEAVAHRNPYPAEQFDENAWNHMVLKALFVGSKLDPIQGLDARANPKLMRMLCDYAHERWAASRPVSPELWRCVGPHADNAAIDDLAGVLARGGAVDRQAAALALAACPMPAAKNLLAQVPDLARAAAAGCPGWAALAAS
jgi:hypothetical protein